MEGYLKRDLVVATYCRNHFATGPQSPIACCGVKHYFMTNLWSGRYMFLPDEITTNELEEFSLGSSAILMCLLVMMKVEVWLKLLN